jgi:hypothetical protein
MRGLNFLSEYGFYSSKKCCYYQNSFSAKENLTAKDAKVFAKINDRIIKRGYPAF